MLRTTNFIAILLFILGEIMVFAANRYDPINASILMLAMLLLALSNLRFIFAPFAPANNRLGSLAIIIGFFASAFFFFDIMAHGLTEHSLHFEKFLFWFPQLLLLGGSVLIATWLYPLGRNDRALGVSLSIAFLAYAASRYMMLSPSAQLITALTLAATLSWLALYKIREF